MERKVLSVSHVNAYIKRVFEQDFVLKNLVVQGEISNFKQHSSGHLYFTMKDATSAINCVMFKSYLAQINFKPKEGMTIIATGSISVYERTGQYQLYVTNMREEGVGLLYQKFEALKQQLLAEGLFEQSIKKPLPTYPKKVGIITSETGAVLRDIIQVATRRNPYIQLILYPSLVQGEGAVEQLVKGLLVFNQMKDVDVIIIGRGGGSIEDLWSFNEERLARAIVASEIPVVSAVGHETDTTIADYVADLRAPTPSAAAELVIPAYAELMQRLEQQKLHLFSRMKQHVALSRQRLVTMMTRLENLSPIKKYEQKYQYINDLQDRLEALMKQRLLTKRYQVNLLNEKLQGLSPYNKIKDGYAYVMDPSGQKISGIARLKVKDSLALVFHDGEAQVTVKSIQAVGGNKDA